MRRARPTFEADDGTEAAIQANLQRRRNRAAVIAASPQAETPLPLGSEAPPSLQLLRELDQPIDEVLLTYFYRGQALLVSISRADLDGLARQRQWGPLAPSDQNFVVEINRETLLPIIEGRRERGEASARTNPLTAQTLPLIELTRTELERGIGLRTVIVEHRVAVESLALTPAPTPSLSDAPAPADVFLVYNRKDAYEVQRIREAFEDQGLRCWYTDSSSVSVGLTAQQIVDKAIRESRVAVVIEGAAPLPSELRLGVDRAKASNKPVIAYRLNDAARAPSAGWRAAIDELIRKVRVAFYDTAAQSLNKASSDSAASIDPATTDAPVIDEAPKKLGKKRAPKSIEQRPAAYRFTSTGEKIDVLAEPPQPLERGFAEDSRQELLGKARELYERLERSNCPRRVCNTVQALIAAVGVEFNDLRPGVLLSRVRSIEADRSAFDTEEVRGELFADAFAMIDDTLQTARDLMAAFPIVRQIEAERLALDLDRHPDAIPAIAQQAQEIQSAAEKSGAATEDAIKALAQNDAAIAAAAANPVVRNSLIADKLLVAGNFVRAVAGRGWAELSELGAASWEAVKENLPKGIGVAAHLGPLMLLTVWIAGPVGALAGATPALKPLAGVFKKMVGKSTKAALAKELSTKHPVEEAKNAAPKKRGRKISKRAISKRRLEAIFLAEAKLTPQWAHLDTLTIKPGATPGSWELDAWGQWASRPKRDEIADIQNLSILHEIATRLNKRYALRQPVYD